MGRAFDPSLKSSNYRLALFRDRQMFRGKSVYHPSTRFDNNAPVAALKSYDNLPTFRPNLSIYSLPESIDNPSIERGIYR